MEINKVNQLIENTKKFKVLYVEDNEETRGQALKVFDNFFTDIDVSFDGADGLEKYKNNSYDLVISDISMPKMNGVEMSKAIFKIDKKQNILIVTAFNDSEQLQELIEIGITHYIHKPINIHSLISELQKITERISIRDKEKNELTEIQKLNHELDALVDSFDTYVIASRTDLGGVITYASKAYQTISGYMESELIGKPHNIVRHPDMPSSAFKDMWKTIQNERLWVGEVKNRKKDGSHYWVKANIAPYYDANQNHIGYSAIRIDITDQKEVQTLNEEVNNLLNNAGQGFLTFDENLKIGKSFSAECLNIFHTSDIYNQDISELLFSNDTVKKELFVGGIQRALGSEEEMIKDMFLSLLPKEHHLGGIDISIEYKGLQNNTFMLILTDITKTKLLESKIKQNNQTQKMIVAIAANQNDFIELKFDFENFIANPSSDLVVLRRELHTFKGIFAQKEMVHIAYGIHQLESEINSNKDADAIEIFNNFNLTAIFNKDLEIVAAALGDEFLNARCKLHVDSNALDALEAKTKLLESEETHERLLGILDDFEKMKYKSIYGMLNSYPTAVKQISQKLQKEIYPLEIVGDKDLVVSPKFKPFIKSLIHLFNNCAEHGIEDMETRVENEKDETGTISCAFSIHDNNLEFKISDDGAGINIEKLTRNAIKKGINIDAYDDKLMLVFADSLSTKDELSTTSGRGVGMSAIKSEADKLGGNIKIKNNIGSGVEFTFTFHL
ncbi:MAG: response regulator [Campylobacteraceae bacterium]|nr:response regulator [Campylobacteraceae bacterium]